MVAAVYFRAVLSCSISFRAREVSVILLHATVLLLARANGLVSAHLPACRARPSRTGALPAVAAASLFGFS